MAKKKKKRWLKYLIIIGVVVIVGGLIAANMAKKKELAIDVTTVDASLGELTQTVPGTGRVQPELQVNISANVSAEIKGLFVEEGDPVKKGDLLVVLDQERYKAAVEQAQSSLKSAEAALSKSESELRRARELYNQGLSSQADLEAAEADYQYRSAEVERSNAYLKEARDNLEKTSLYSPMDGIVSLLNKELGEMALGAQFQQDIIMIVSDLSKMEVVVEVDESDIINVALRDTATIKIDAYPDTTFKGVVREIAHTATTRGLGTSEEITNFEVKIRLLDVPSSLRPGMSATADVITEVRSNTLHIPIQCVVMKTPLKEKPETPEGEAAADSVELMASADPNPGTNNGGKSEKEEPIEVVFVVRDGIVKQVAVETGISSDTDIEILAGLEENDMVVSGPFRTLTHQLKDGDAVKVEADKTAEGRGSRQGNPQDEAMMDEM